VRNLGMTNWTLCWTLTSIKLTMRGDATIELPLCLHLAPARPNWGKAQISTTGTRNGSSSMPSLPDKKGATPYSIHDGSMCLSGTCGDIMSHPLIFLLLPGSNAPSLVIIMNESKKACGLRFLPCQSHESPVPGFTQSYVLPLVYPPE
jgi:hypothetical protein